MTLTRRRFLTVSAAFAGLPAAAQAHSWRGFAFGAEVSLTIRGPKDRATAALTQARDIITQIEVLFSLYDPHSDLSRLNAAGRLTAPDPRFHSLMQACDQAFAVTDGLFDPTVQPLWQDTQQGILPHAAAANVGWQKLRFDAHRILLGPSQQLTFNGIAQGYATDLVSNALQAHGLRNVLVNIGEYRGIGGPWTLGLTDPTFGRLGHRTLGDGAIATSSPKHSATTAHILHPTARPLWSTVSVEAPSATLADSLSTAMVLAPRDQVAAIVAQTDVSRVTLISPDGDLITL
ncbi:MAG: FAD:protein FMN transferase [Sulfitobacter sp.]